MAELKLENEIEVVEDLQTMFDIVLSNLKTLSFSCDNDTIVFPDGRYNNIYDHVIKTMKLLSDQEKDLYIRKDKEYLKEYK